MSVPAAQSEPKQSADVSSFYGRSYPRASILLDQKNEIRNDRKMPPPTANAPLLDWAKKADWNMGGAKEVRADPKPPRPAFTPIYAFLARKQLKLKQLHPQLSDADTLALAKLDAAAEWEGLTAEEQGLYVQLADQDTERYDRELAAFELEHPGFLASRKEHSRGVKLATKPRSPLTAFRAYLQEKLTITPPGEDIQPRLLKDEAALEWKKMTDKERAPFEDLAEEDLKRWELELDNFPEYKALIAERAKERQARQQERAAKKQIFKAAKKRPTRPGKLGLPKPKPIVKEGKLTKGTAKKGEELKSASRKQRSSRKQQAEENYESESETEEEEEEPDLGASDSGDGLESESEQDSNDEASSDDAEDEEEEEDGQSAAPPAVPSDQDAEEADVEISEDEDEQAPASRRKALAAEAALDASGEAEDEDDLLRMAQTPADLLVEPSSKDGLFGWAKSALMSGIKGVWSRGQKTGEQTPAKQAAQEEARGEALVGRSFTKRFDNKPYAGKVQNYLPEFKWYYVEYEDGDNEELVEAELLSLLGNKTRESRNGDGVQGGPLKKRRV